MTSASKGMKCTSCGEVHPYAYVWWIDDETGQRLCRKCSPKPKFEHPKVKGTTKGGKRDSVPTYGGTGRHTKPKNKRSR